MEETHFFRLAVLHVVDVNFKDLLMMTILVGKIKMSF